MKVYTWVEWKEIFKREAGSDKQKQHDLDCSGLVLAADAQKLEKDYAILIGRLREQGNTGKQIQTLKNKIAEANKVLNEAPKLQAPARISDVITYDGFIKRLISILTKEESVNP